LTVHRLEELSTPGLDALDRARTVVILSVSPLETHGPHLPLGVDAFTARHFAEAIAERVVASRPGFTVVLAPTLYLGSFTFDTVGTVAVRQRLVRDVYFEDLARRGRVKQLTAAAQTLQGADLGAMHLATYGRPIAALELAWVRRALADDGVFAWPVLRRELARAPRPLRALADLVSSGRGIPLVIALPLAAE